MKRFLSYLVFVLAVGFATVVAQPEGPARALPPAGADMLPVTATVDVGSRLGSDSVILTGWVRLERQAPHIEGGVGVVDIEVIALDLRGASQLGAVSVRTQTEVSSTGEFRSLQPGQDYPASSSLNLYLQVTVPASPIGSLDLHNEEPLIVRPVEGGQEVPLQAWPPLGVTYQLDAIFGVDNDGDGLIDEDTADDDNDGLIDEDRPGPDPDTPGFGSECGNDPDCDGLEGEDPPIELCTLEVCDADGDGLMDEDPACIPLLNAGGTHLKAGLCVRNIMITIAPEAPSYSVARGGPSPLHPADVLALTPRPELAAGPAAVSGNDDFAGAWEIPELPFIGQQNTASATIETVNTGFLSPAASSPDGAAGDGDGFEVSPEGAFADGGGFAEDVDSGTGPVTSCFGAPSPDADRHVFRDFNIDTEGLENTIKGIELRLDAWADAAGGVPQICAHMSADGGTTWSPFPHGTGILSDSEETYILGSPSDVWRAFLPWTPDELTNENFRVRLTNVSDDESRDFRLDWLAARFYTKVEPSTAACGMIGATTWYRFTPLVSEVVTFDTIGSNFDTVLVAFTGDDVFTASLLACNDDFGVLGGPSRLFLPVSAGTTYYLQAGGFRGDSGDLVVNAGTDTSLAPFVRIACPDLGLSADGCDDGSDGDQDDLDALSYGLDLAPGEPLGVNFSVGPGAQGAAGSAVEAQRNCPPSSPGLSPEAEGDVFGSLLDGANSHVLDGNGPIGTCPSAFPLGLVEGATVRDDLNALAGRDAGAVDEDDDGVPDSPVYFSLAAGSPSLAAFGYSAADILRTVGGGQPTLFASAATLGLQSGDDVDALCLRESGDQTFGAGDVLYFSLAPGSPSLSGLGEPGDLLSPGPFMVQQAGPLGLLAGDDLNALTCRALSDLPGGDVNCSGETDSIDAALVLQLEAGLIAGLACGDQADVNQDGVTNSIDAVIILQFIAGLIERLPVP